MMSTSLALLLGGLAISPSAPIVQNAQTTNTQVAPAPIQPPAADKQLPAEAMTEAEKITRIRETISRGKQGLAKMEARLEDPMGEYAMSEADFQEMDAKLKSEQDAIAAMAKDPAKAEEKAKRESELKLIQEQWTLSRDRFNLAIRQRKATQEAIAALKVRLEQEQKQLEKLEGKGTAAVSREGAPMPATATTPATTSATPTPSPTPTPPVTTAKTPEKSATPSVAPTLPGIPSLQGLPGAAATTPPATATTTTTQVAPSDPPAETEDPEIKKARELVQIREQALRQAQEKSISADERVKALEQMIRAANQVLEAERDSATQAKQAQAMLDKQLKTQPPADPAARQALAARAKEAETRYKESEARIARSSARLVLMNEELRGLKQEQDIAKSEASTRKAEEEAAREEMSKILNPFSTHNILRWVISHGPKLLMILFGIGVLYLIIRQFSRQIVRVVTRHSHRGSDDDRENRANTLVGVFRYTGSVFVLGGGLVMFLDEAGIPVVPLMGGAAVVGLAVAFGAQNLIRDYFTGFMILMEDQYGVNDVVKIGTTAGLVESITLRVTALRDLEGVLHFIPHGSITTVSNLTHTWSRAQIDVPVPYDADLEHVMSVLKDLGREMRNDAFYGLKITEDPDMLGVEEFGDSAITIRFLLKTRPLQQWSVKREMLRRIKIRFDQLGISIPFPQRTIHHKFPDGVPYSGHGSRIISERDGYEHPLAR